MKQLRDTKDVKAHLKWAKEQATHCFYCGDVFTGAKTIDHFFPTSKEITEYKNRKVIVCERCNHTKDNMHPFELLNKAQTAAMSGLPFMTWEGNRLQHLIRSLQMIFRHVKKKVFPQLYIIVDKRRIYLDSHGIDKINRLKS